MSAHNKDCGRTPSTSGNSAFIILIIFILLAIIVGGRFF